MRIAQTKPESVDKSSVLRKRPEKANEFDNYLVQEFSIGEDAERRQGETFRDEYSRFVGLLAPRRLCESRGVVCAIRNGGDC